MGADRFYSRFPLGANVVGITTLIACIYLIVIYSIILHVIGSPLENGCNYPDRNETLLYKILDAVKTVIESDPDYGESFFGIWLSSLEGISDSCAKIIHPVMGTTVAGIVIICILFFLTLMMMFGIREHKPVLNLPFLFWFGIVITYVVGTAIAIGSYFPERIATTFIIVSILLMVIPCYHFGVVVKHHNEASKVQDRERLIRRSRKHSS